MSYINKNKFITLATSILYQTTEHSTECIHPARVLQSGSAGRRRWAT